MPSMGGTEARGRRRLAFFGEPFQGLAVAEGQVRSLTVITLKRSIFDMITFSILQPTFRCHRWARALTASGPAARVPCTGMPFESPLVENRPASRFFTKSTFLKSARQLQFIYKHFFSYFKKMLVLRKTMLTILAKCASEPVVLKARVYPQSPVRVCGCDRKEVGGVGCRKSCG